MTGYSRRSTQYPDAPVEDFRHRISALDVEQVPQRRQDISWWHAWGERTFYLMVFVAFVALLVLGGTWR